MDLALDLMAEFVFCEVDRRGNKKSSPLNVQLEIQLLEVLFDYFNSSQSESTKNAIFLSLFSGTTAVSRSRILNKFVSIAVGISSSVVLTAASIWMQQLGNTSSNSCKLAESLVNDYFIFIPSVDRLKSLPDTSPPFAANFLTAVGEIYYSDTKKGQFLLPPQPLLEIVAHWISENHKLCVAAQETHPILPPGAILMEATTPICGLIKWCVLAPIYKQTNDYYGHLHLALLNSLLEIPSNNPPRVISAQHLSIPVGYICRYVVDEHSRIKKRQEKYVALEEDPNLQLALDRYAQAVQVALYTKSVYGNLEELINQLCQLPHNKLLSIVINRHKQNK